MEDSSIIDCRTRQDLERLRTVICLREELVTTRKAVRAFYIQKALHELDETGYVNEKRDLPSEADHDVMSHTGEVVQRAFKAFDIIDTEAGTQVNAVPIGSWAAVLGARDGYTKMTGRRARITNHTPYTLSERV